MITINKPKSSGVPLKDIEGATFFEGNFFGYTGLFYKTSMYGVVYMDNPSVTWSDNVEGIVTEYRRVINPTIKSLDGKSKNTTVSLIPNGAFFTGMMLRYEGLFLKTAYVLLHFPGDTIHSWGANEFHELNVADYNEVDVRVDL